MITLNAVGGVLRLGTLENPNRMPFSGVLTYLAVPSDLPPGGSGGLKVLIPKDVGLEAVSSLKGMPVNLKEDLDDHDTKKVVGVIEDAWLGDLQADGSIPVNVKGYIFAKNFPDAAVTVKAAQRDLGFSYETSNTELEPGNYKGEQVAVAKKLVFTGAAILLKKSAAYQKTSLAAKGAGEMPITDEDFAKLTQSVGTIADTVTKLTAAFDQRFTKLETDLQAAKLSSEQRKNMDNDEFALPDKRMFPMMDEDHVKMAWDMVARAKDLTDAEREEARKNILKKAEDMKMDTSGWKKDLKGAGEDVEAKEITAALEKLTETVTSLATDVAELKAGKAPGKEPEKKEDLKAKGQEPQRKSKEALVSKEDELKAKGEKEEKETKETDVFASIDKRELDPVQSIAAKLSAVYK